MRRRAGSATGTARTSSSTAPRATRSTSTSTASSTRCVCSSSSSCFPARTLTWPHARRVARSRSPRRSRSGSRTTSSTAWASRASKVRLDLSPELWRRRRACADSPRLVQASTGGRPRSPCASSEPTRTACARSSRPFSTTRSSSGSTSAARRCVEPATCVPARRAELTSAPSSRSQRDTAGPDQTKARALEALEPISNKLLGLQVTSDPESVAVKEVAVSEQVERLIREARDPKNLGSMYVGVRPSPLSLSILSSNADARCATSAVVRVVLALEEVPACRASYLPSNALPSLLRSRPDLSLSLYLARRSVARCCTPFTAPHALSRFDS